VHLATLQLAPILGAEKSKVPFYIAGGALVVWALIVSLGLGLRRPDFPSSLAGQRAVIAITAVLVVATLSMAVVTSGGSTKAEASSSSAVVPSGPSTQTPAGTAVTALKLAANPSGQLAYNAKQLSAKAGDVTITMTNMSPLEHNVTIAQGSTVLGSTPTFIGGSKTLTLNLKPGTYTFYCSVPGHRQAGMEGTLTVS
jgi:plastocyanin